MGGNSSNKNKGIKGYFIKVFNGMALGLFSSLSIGSSFKNRFINPIWYHSSISYGASHRCWSSH